MVTLWFNMSSIWAFILNVQLIQRNIGVRVAVWKRMEILMFSFLYHIKGNLKYDKISLNLVKMSLW